jgi:hypothetical protein
MRYEVVSHDAVLAALNSELITAYVEAVMLPSNPERKTFDMIADNDSESNFSFLIDVLTDLGPKKSFGCVQISAAESNSGCSSYGPDRIDSTSSD